MCVVVFVAPLTGVQVEIVNMHDLQQFNQCSSSDSDSEKDDNDVEMKVSQTVCGLALYSSSSESIAGKKYQNTF